MKIAVAGATGRVGKYVVDVLKSRGHEVVAISRSAGVDIITGEGLTKALKGVERIVDASSSPSPEEKAATEFFTTATRNLQEVGKQEGVQRIIVISIIGIDRFTSGYMAAKIAHEKAMMEGPIPARILRAAQFHELVGQMVEWGRQGDVSYLPKMQTQLVAARTAAEALADLAEDAGPASGPTLEIAGPKPEELVAAAKRLIAWRGDKVRIEGVSTDPDAALYESGAVLPGPNATLAGPTFDEWLKSTSRLAA